MRFYSFLILIGLFYSESFSELKKQPYLLYTGNNTQMKVAYQLYETDTCNISWGVDSSSLTKSMATEEYGDDHQHASILTDLVPGTRYFYTVSQGIYNYKGSFFAAPDTNKTKLNFFAYGDTRSYPADHNTIAGSIINEFTADSSFQSLIVVVGDLVNDGDDESDWGSEFFNPDYPNTITMLSNIPYQACMGNHEESGELFKKYFPYPFVDNRYWSFDYGPAHFVVVDQYTSYSLGSTQLTWIENDLASSSKPWKFIILHEPGWTAGGHGNNSDVQSYLQPLCEQYGVQIVFGGHNHYYAHADVNYVKHITTGGGGAPLYAPSQNNPNIVTVVEAHHYCKIKIEDDLLYFSAIDEDGITIDDFIVNRYRITPIRTSLSAFFAHIESDSLLLLTELTNPEAHSVNLHAYIHSLDSTYLDSVECFDDGVHGDGEANDGIWGNYIGHFPVEDRYTVDISVIDLDSDLSFLAPGVIDFTTIGPLSYNGHSFAEDSLIHPGDSPLLYLDVSNNGMLATASNVYVNLSFSDETYAHIVGGPSRPYGNIEADSTVSNSLYFWMNIHDDCPTDTNLVINMAISSDGTLFWEDSFSIYIQPVVGISDREISIPQEYSLSQNYPNPFNPTTTISYTLPEQSVVTLTVFDIRGQEIMTLQDVSKPPGNYEVQWNGIDQLDNQVSTGVYFARLDAGDYNKTIKMVYLK